MHTDECFLILSRKSTQKIRESAGNMVVEADPDANRGAMVYFCLHDWAIDMG